MHGLFISFEGIDGSGKSTQASLLFEKLVQDGMSTIYLREPGGTKISEKIRELLLDVENIDMTERAEFLLYAASRAQLVQQKIQPALNAGQIVICDRFIDSSTAYQGIGRRLGDTIIEEINRFATANLVPDMTFIIDIPLQTSIERTENSELAPDRLENEKTEFKQRVIDAYRRLAQKHPERIRTLSGENSIEQISNDIWKLVAPQIELMKKKRQHENS